MNNFNSKLIGLGQSILNKDYQANLDSKIDSILGEKDNISVNELKKSSIFKEAFEKIDNSKLENIFKLDGNAENISEKELRVLLTLLDSNLENVDGKERFVLDSQEGYEKSSGIYEATDNEIQTIYNNTKTRAEKKKLELAKKEQAEQAGQAKIQQLETERDFANNILQNIKQYQLFKTDGKINGANVAKLFKELKDNIKCNNAESIKIFDNAIEKAFAGKVKSINTPRSGKVLEFDGYRIEVNYQALSNEYGYVTVSSGTKEEKYTPNGELVQ